MEKVEICQPIDVPLVVQNMGHCRIDWEKIRSCSIIQKQKLLLFIDKLVDYEKKILAGKLNLSGLLDCFEELFLRYAISLLKNGLRYEIISDILYNFISSSELSSDVYLKYVIFIRFVLEEKKGFHDIITLRAVLLSYLGVEFILHSELPEWIDDGIDMLDDMRRLGKIQ